MKVVVDAGGRIVLPKQLREKIGLVPGMQVDISQYGHGIQVIPAGRTARVEDEDGRLVAVSDTPVTDDDVFELIDSVRR
jgi:AbrB family looped-hinge helix DNA binding protein